MVVIGFAHCSLSKPVSEQTVDLFQIYWSHACAHEKFRKNGNFRFVRFFNTGLINGCMSKRMSKLENQPCNCCNSDFSSEVLYIWPSARMHFVEDTTSWVSAKTVWKFMQMRALEVVLKTGTKSIFRTLPYILHVRPLLAQKFMQPCKRCCTWFF